MRLTVYPNFNVSILYFVCVYYLYQFYKYIKKQVKDKNLIKFNLLLKLKNIYTTITRTIRNKLINKKN